jgi:hypothetical protein
MSDLQENEQKPAVVQQPTVYRHAQDKSNGALFSGVFAGVAAYLASFAWLRNKLMDFDAGIATKTREDIMSKPGAGLASISAELGEDAIRQHHTLEKIKSGKYPFAKLIYTLGGKSNAAAVVGLAVGGLAAAAYLAVKPKRNDLPVAQPVQAGTSEEGQVNAPVVEVTIATHQAPEKAAEKIADKDDAQELSSQLLAAKGDPMAQAKIIESWQLRQQQRETEKSPAQAAR